MCSVLTHTVDAVMAALCACLLCKTKACTAYSKHSEYHSSVMKDMCSNIECIFFSFFSASRKPKSRIDLLNEPGKDGLNKKNVRKLVGQSAAVRIQEDYHVTQIVQILTFPTETHQFYLVKEL